ncbi:hypothetical protein Trichorick_01452 (plasmid) [Candidatus Trichorickettsia mobilis]|uniref:Phage tail tape measure protein n=1 Tax=Candidatus Trichorickettsia mobilis TaxID=1346319 RepID=A0ABZ0UX79_9RICK|nr:hypothetical protein [Candidatus Trichorickettsia mobilis]WPY01539.1 hypothetical protein Trichorick_01452 [Candidatus Trichorickettsia mobilis]
MIVRELVTKLSFALDKSGLNESFKGLQELTRKANNAQQSLKKTIGWTATGTSLNIDDTKQSNSTANVLREIIQKTQATLGAFGNSVAAALYPAKKQADFVETRFQKILAHKQEIHNLSVAERKEVNMLNAAEKQAMREVAAEKRKLDAEEKRRIKELNREKKKQNLISGLKTINQAASRSLLGIFGGATASLGFSYKEYKRYKEKRVEGLITKTSLTSDQIKQFDAFDKKFSAFKENINSIRNAFATALLPVLQPLIEQFNKWYGVNKKIVNAKIKEWAETLAKVFKKIWNVLVGYVIPAVSTVIKAFGGLENVVLALIGIKVAGWIANISSLFISLTSLIMGPLGPILLVVGGLWFLYDEIKVTMEGGESLIKHFAELPYIDWVIDKLSKLANAYMNVMHKARVFFHGEEAVKAADSRDLRKEIAEKIMNSRKREAFISATDKSGLLPILGSNRANLTTSMPQYDKNSSGLVQDFFANTISALKPKPYDLNKITDFLTTSMPYNKSNQVTNNVGGIKIIIQNQGTIDENSIPKVTDIIQQEVTKAISDTFVINKAGLVS